MKLTTRQGEILLWIQKFTLEEGYSPTLQEIANGFGFGINAAVDHLGALKRHGRVKWVENKARTITIIDE